MHGLLRLPWDLCTTLCDITSIWSYFLQLNALLSQLKALIYGMENPTSEITPCPDEGEPAHHVGAEIPAHSPAEPRPGNAKLRGLEEQSPKDRSNRVLLKRRHSLWLGGPTPLLPALLVYLSQGNHLEK